MGQRRASTITAHRSTAQRQGRDRHQTGLPLPVRGPLCRSWRSKLGSKFCLSRNQKLVATTDVVALRARKDPTD